MEPPPRPSDPSSEPQQRPPWIAQEGGPGSLPVFLTSFVGREDEIALANSLLQRPDLRLLTLTGSGGIGKTRLAVEIAAQSDVHFSDGVSFVSLASIQDPSMVMMTVAAALGLHELDGTSIDDIVASSLRTSNALLVIDNFEHVMDASPALSTVLARCPQLKIMVTSRSLLRLEGEHAIPVPPLVLPRTNATMTGDDWLRVPVIALFIERAGAVDPSLDWNPDNILRLVEICGRLDGLPLAVELAATRVRHLSLVEINDRLNDLLPLLVDGSRDHPSRLQTMRNAISWSYDLLPPDAQELLRRSSVFSGGFTREAIAGVSRYLDVESSKTAPDKPGNRPIDADLLTSIDEGLSRLIDASLLIRETGPIAGTTRYRMLETIREYAWEQLVRHDEEQRARQAHATYFTNYAVQREIAELTPVHVQYMDQLIVEQDNLRSALMWLRELPDREDFGRLVATLGRFWLAQSNYQEGRTWSERALAVRDTLQPYEVARILVSLGMAELFQQDNEPAEAHLTQGVAASQEQGEAHSATLAFIGLASVAIERGDGERGTQLLEQSREYIAAIPEARLARVMAGWVSVNLGIAARTSGLDKLAEQHFEDALGRFKSEPFHVGTMMVLGDLGDLARDRGEWPRALSLYKEALIIDRTDQAKRFLVEVIEAVAIVAAHAGQWDRSATLLGAAEGLRDRTGLRYRQPKNHSSVEAVIETTRAGLPAETFSTAWNAGRNLTESQAIAEVLDLNVSGASSQKFSLTARESEILQLLATGMTDPEIADSLFISVRTVEHHVASVFRKLGVRTRVAATSTAIAAGLVTAGGSA